VRHSRAIFVAVLFMMPTAYGYEVGTPARVTDEAYKRSTLFIGPKLAQFGLLDLSKRSLDATKWNRGNLSEICLRGAALFVKAASLER